MRQRLLWCMRAQDAVLPALAVLEAAAAALGACPPAAVAPQGPRKGATGGGVPPAPRLAEALTAQPDPAQAAGPAGSPQAHDAPAGDLSLKPCLVINVPGLCCDIASQLMCSMTRA